MPAPLLNRQRVGLLARGVVRRSRKARRLQPPFPFGAPPVPVTVDAVEPAQTLGPHYDSEWARRPSARVARRAIVEGVLRPGLAVVAKPERIGLDRLSELDADAPTIFVANHHSHLDTSLLLTSIPHRWRNRLVVMAAADYFFDKRVKATVSALAIGAVPMDRYGTGRASADQAAELLEQGNSLVIFPEGGRSPDGWGQPFKGGAAYLALRCNAPIVPVFIAGSSKVWRKGQRLPKPARTAVVFGEPVHARDGETTRRLNARVEAAVTSLGDEFTSDWWQARKRFHQGDAPSMTGPRASSWRRAWALGDRTTRESTRPSWPR